MSSPKKKPLEVHLDETNEDWLAGMRKSKKAGSQVRVNRIVAKVIRNWVT